MVATGDNYSLPIDVLVDRYYNVFSFQDPSGTYYGTKSVVGQNIDITVDILDSTHVHFTVAGAIKIECPSVYFSYVAPNLIVGQPGDCLETALAANKVSIDSIVYDPTADDVDVKVKYSIVTISITLAKKTATAVVVPAKNSEFILPMSVLFDRSYNIFIRASPAGTYQGYT